MSASGSDARLGGSNIHSSLPWYGFTLAATLQLFSGKHIFHHINTASKQYFQHFVHSIPKRVQLFTGSGEGSFFVFFSPTLINLSPHFGHFARDSPHCGTVSPSFGGCHGREHGRPLVPRLPRRLTGAGRLPVRVFDGKRRQKTVAARW